MKLKDRVAIVTGAGHGVGKAIAYRLFEDGATVVVTDADQTEIDHVAGVIQEQGGRSAAIRCDVSDHAQVTKLVESTLQVFGRVDCLINNAGDFVGKPLTETTTEDFDNVVNGHLKGAFLFSRAVLPNFKERGSGRIVNVSSLFGMIPGSNVSVYSMAKAGLVGFTRALARELHPLHINVNAVAPGSVRTDEEAIELEETRWKLGEHLLPRDVADVVAFLLTDGASQMTGGVIDVPGATSFRVAEVSKRDD